MADYIRNGVPARCLPRNAQELLPAVNLRYILHTRFDGCVGILEKTLDVFALGVQEWEGDVDDVGRHLEVLHARGRRDDRFDVVLGEGVGIGGGVEVPDEELA